MNYRQIHDHSMNLNANHLLIICLKEEYYCTFPDYEGGCGRGSGEINVAILITV